MTWFLAEPQLEFEHCQSEYWAGEVMSLNWDGTTSLLSQTSQHPRCIQTWLNFLLASNPICCQFSAVVMHNGTKILWLKMFFIQFFFVNDSNSLHLSVARI